MKPAISTAASITCLIVDDEPLARQGVRDQLALHDNVDIVGEAGSFHQALVDIERLRPDAVFLDIHLPDGDGLSILQTEQRHQFPVVVVTSAFERYALRGFDAGVEDYVLKPLSEARFAIAMERVRTRVQLRRLGVARGYDQLRRNSESNCVEILPIGEDKEKNKTVAQTHIFVRDGRRRVAILVQHIQSIEAAGDYVCISSRDGVVVCGETIRSILRRLPESMFVRIHRSRVVAKNAIAAIEPRRDGVFAIRLNNGVELRSSRSRQAHVSALLDGY